MVHVKLKALLYGMLLVSSISLTQCKSKPKETETTPQSTTTDQSTTTTTTPTTDQSVQVSPDETLQTGLKDATKDYPGVKTQVNNGEVTLTGNISRDKLPALMQSLNSLHPKKINNNLTIK
jgi:membrane-bound lytic murein transglycosylase